MDLKNNNNDNKKFSPTLVYNYNENFYQDLKHKPLLNGKEKSFEKQQGHFCSFACVYIFSLYLTFNDEKY